MGVAPAGCDYAEARFVDERSELVAVRNGRVDRVDTFASAGVGVRARVNGAWGFAATGEVSAEGLRGALARAIAPRGGAGPGGPAEARGRRTACPAEHPRPAGGGRAWAAELAPEPPA